MPSYADRQQAGYLAYTLVIVFGVTAIFTGLAGLLLGPWIALIATGAVLLLFVILLRTLFLN